jgi:transglutaminase-like putative cysteine protease
MVGVDLRAIAEGDAGIYETVRIMQALIAEGMAHPVVRMHAEHAVAGRSHANPRDEVEAIARYILDRVDYRPDPVTTEWLQTPWYVLHCCVEQGVRPQLDCDDLTVLSLAMAGAIGIPTAIRVASTLPTQEFDHVLGLVWIEERWVPLDLTGMPPARWTRVEDFGA